MNFDPQAFRARYRAGISARYNPWLHATFVLAYGALCLGFFYSRLDTVQPLEWLTIVLTLVFFNWGEYTVHKNLGHHKHRLSALFYQRHTGDHHSFFVPGQMRYESAQDWRVILFPAWLIIIYSSGLFAAWWLLSLFNGNVAGLFASSMLLGYLSYEIFHACEHLPDQHPVARLPWIRHMRRLHELHHRRDLMQSKNFNIVFPLMDWLRGTLYWQPLEPQPYATVMQHEVEIAYAPERVLAYASCATRWPEWHPSSLRVYGPSGSLAAGSHFDEDIVAGGRTGQLSWDVLEYVAGQRWQARATGNHDLHLLVTYECHAIAGGTRFVRTLEYHLPGLVMRLLNHFVLRQRIERESAESLFALRHAAERVLGQQSQA